MLRSQFLSTETANKIFTGKHKFTVGIIFIFGNLAGYFHSMRKINVSDTESIILLAIFIFLARLIV